MLCMVLGIQISQACYDWDQEFIVAEIQNTQDNRKLRLEMSVWKALYGLLWCLVFTLWADRMPKRAREREQWTDL